MSEFRDIWSKAVEANQALALRQRFAEDQFALLLQDHPTDAMIFYERAEAFEYLADLERAGADYRQAQRLFPVEHWKEVAELGIRRIDMRRAGRKPPRDQSTQWEAFHFIHQVPEAPHNLRFAALSAIERIDSEPTSSAASLRVCVEEIQRYANRRGLRLPEAQTRLIRNLGNRGAHGYDPISRREVNELLRAFMSLMEWAAASLWARPASTDSSNRRV